MEDVKAALAKRKIFRAREKNTLCALIAFKLKKHSEKVIFNSNTCCYLCFDWATSYQSTSEIVENTLKKERKKQNDRRKYKIKSL